MTEVLHFKIPLSEKAIAAIDDIISEKDDEISKEEWISKKVGDDLKKATKLRNQLNVEGEIKLYNGKVVKQDDLLSFPLESFPEGSVELLIGEKRKGKIELSVSLIDASNRLLGGPKLSWDTSRDYLYKVILDAIEEELKTIEDKELDDEEKAIYKKKP